MPTEQLEYLNLLMAEEPNQQQQPQAATPVPYPELQPCNPQWTLASAQDCLDPLEDEVLSLGEANRCAQVDKRSMAVHSSFMTSAEG